MSRSAAGGETTCRGAHCFSAAFGVMTSLSVVALVFSFLLWWKTVRLYKKLQVSQPSHPYWAANRFLEVKDELMHQRESLK
eukprot:scaffold389555_cov15-Prasinocladus_malaysianus.AAC.1